MALAIAQAADRRRDIDLETFLTWAIRDQKADRTDTAMHGTEAVAHFGLLRGLPIGASVCGTGISADGCVVIANRNEIGADIDGAGTIRGIAPRVHPDAELAADVIQRLPSYQRRLVLHHARLGFRPDWLAPAHRQPMVGVKRPGEARGRYRYVTAERWEVTPTQSVIAARYLARGKSLFDRHGRRRLPEEEKGFRFRYHGDGTREILVKWCPLEPLHLDWEVRDANQEYQAWHTGMVSVLKGLNRGVPLAAHRIGDFRAPQRPWDQIP